MSWLMHRLGLGTWWDTFYHFDPQAAKTDKQLERLQGKLAQQAEAISQLKTHKAELEKLRVMYSNTGYLGLGSPSPDDL